MAYTLHWSNHSSADAGNTKKNRKKWRYEDELDRLKSLDPILSIQRDVLFPRAEASFDEEFMDTSTVGCVGHAVDKEFPLKQNGKNCTPLVFMRDATDLSGKNLAEDICAKPVLNWEKYCLELKASVKGKVKRKSDKPPEESGEDCKEARRERGRTVEKFVSIPEFRVEGTWNYKFTNKGACDWVPGNQRKCQLKLAVGNGNKLRIVSLAANRVRKDISYRVTKVQEEFFVEDSDKPEIRDSFDCIYQISSVKAEDVIVSRRNSRIDLYDVESSPRKLESIKPGGYSQVYKEKKNTSFLTFDTNPESVNEIASLDSSMMLQFHDFVAEKSARPVLLAPELGLKIHSEQQRNVIRKFTINEATGISYAVNPALLYIHHDSKVYLYDRRKPLYSSLNLQEQCYELLDLKNNLEIISISDHSSVSYDGSDMRADYISCVQRSCNSNYYYVGTSSRIFTMDWRVPRNPVVRSSHGMKGPMSYMEIVSDGGNEIVVGASQRGHESFSMVLDYKHEDCRARVGCIAINPILKSYPRHLSEPSSCFEAVQDSWNHQSYRVKARMESWCSGVTAAVIPICDHRRRWKDIPPVFIASTNTFGDVFYQEWFPPGVLDSFAGSDSSKPFKLDLLPKSSKVSPILATNPLREDASDTVDCSILVEESGSLLKKFGDVRSNPFVSINPLPEGSAILEFLCADMRNYKAPMIEKFVSVWENTQPFSHPRETQGETSDADIEAESAPLESASENQNLTDSVPSEIQIKEESPESEFTQDSDIEEIPSELKSLDTAVPEEVVSDIDDYASNVFGQSLSQAVYQQFQEDSFGMNTLELACSSYADYRYSTPAYPSASQSGSFQLGNNVSLVPSQSQKNHLSSSSQSQNIPKRRAGFL